VCSGFDSPAAHHVSPHEQAKIWRRANKQSTHREVCAANALPKSRPSLCLAPPPPGGLHALREGTVTSVRMACAYVQDPPHDLFRRLRVLVPPTRRWVHASGDGPRRPPYARPSEEQEEYVQSVPMGARNNCQDDTPSDGEANAVYPVVPESKRHVPIVPPPCPQR
jgi:hypothetical protein